jgi:hypothetical protein
VTLSPIEITQLHNALQTANEALGALRKLLVSGGYRAGATITNLNILTAAVEGRANWLDERMREDTRRNPTLAELKSRKVKRC